jgi:single-stranded DNA-binding protein
MGRSINKIVILGYVGNPPKINTFRDKESVSFTVATSNVWKDKTGQINKDTQWHNIVVFNAVFITLAKELQKGSLVYIEGTLKTRNLPPKPDMVVDESVRKDKIIEVVLGGYSSRLVCMDENMSSMNSLNSVSIMGTLANDPVTHPVKNGDMVVFHVFTVEKWKDKRTGTDHEDRQRHRIVIYNINLIEIAQKLQKGSKVFITGILKSRPFKIKNEEGQPQVTPFGEGPVPYETDIILGTHNSELIVLDRRNNIHNENNYENNYYSDNQKKEYGQQRRNNFEEKQGNYHVAYQDDASSYREREKQSSFYRDRPYEKNQNSGTLNHISDTSDEELAFSEEDFLKI